MMLRSSILLAALLASAASYECNGTLSIDAPSDLSQATYFPAGWTEDQPLPQLAKDQGCMITVNVPPGVFATVTIHKHFGTISGCYVLYSNNKYRLINDDDLHPYIFTAPHFKLNVGVSSSFDGVDDPKFAFKVVWSQFPELKQSVKHIYKGNPPVVVSANADLTTFIGGSNSLISLMAFSLKDQSQEYLLRQSAVFAGDSVYGEFAGTLDQILSSHQKVTTYINKMSVYTFGLSQSIDYPLFMAQDLDDTRKANVYEGFNCPSTGNCNVTLYGNYGYSWTVSDFNGSEYVKDFTTFPDTASISVYENNISNSTFVATLTSSNYKSMLPLEVKGTMKFYVLNGYGNCDMIVTRDTSRASRL